MTQEELNERAKKAVLTYNINESKKVAQDALDQNAIPAAITAAWENLELMSIILNVLSC